MKPILDLIFGIGAVFAGMCLRPKILLVGPVASDLYRDEVIFFVILWISVLIPVFGDLLDR